MVYLYDQMTGDLLGEITDQQLQFLIDQLEEESLEDRDYSITNMEIDFFESMGADASLITTLRQALGSNEEDVIQWSRKLRRP
jgi:processive 1,2-diacylglycerol beta-glucosyltransferase